MSNSQFHVSFTFWNANDYRYECERICINYQEALIYVREFLPQGDLLNPRFTYYPAGKKLIDACDRFDIDYRPSVAPASLSFQQLVERVYDDIESTYVMCNDF